MPQYDVRTSSLPDRTRIAVLLDWADTRMLCAIRQPQAGLPELVLRDVDDDADIQRVSEFVLAVGKNVRIAPKSNAFFFANFDGKLKYTLAYVNGTNRIRFTSYQDLHSYLRANDQGVDSELLQVEVIHERAS